MGQTPQHLGMGWARQQDPSEVFQDKCRGKIWGVGPPFPWKLRLRPCPGITTVQDPLRWETCQDHLARAVYQEQSSLVSFKAVTTPAAQQKGSGSRPAATRGPANPCPNPRPPPYKRTCPPPSCDTWQPRSAGGQAQRCLFLILRAHAWHHLGGCCLHGCWKILWRCFPSLPSHVWELEGRGGGWRGFRSFTCSSHESAVPATCDGSLLDPVKP